MGTDLEITSRLSRPAVIERLTAFGKDWRESKLPESIRRRGIFGCAITVSGDTFDLKLEPQGRGPILAWHGTIVSERCDHGVSIRLSWKLTTINILGYALLVALLIWIYRDVGIATTLVMAVFVIGLAVLSAFWQADQQAPLCYDILDHVIGRAMDTSPPAI